MDDGRSIASKAASIVLGVDNSGKRWWKGSAVKGPFSPYFNPAFNLGYKQPLANITNINVHDAGKVNYSKFPEDTIYGKKVFHRRKNQDSPNAPKFSRDEVSQNWQDVSFQSVNPHIVKFASGNQGQVLRSP